MTLAERIHLRMIQRKHTRIRLAGIPPAVIEEVIRLGVEALADMVPMCVRAHELAEIEFAVCEGCGHLVDPDRPEGAAYGEEDGVWLCDACQVEGGGVAPAPSTDDGGRP